MQDRPSSITVQEAHRVEALSSPELLAALDRVAAQGRELTADLVALLAECDERKLYAQEGYASLFEFCVQRLRLSESQAYHRIQAARAARRFPLVVERLRDGRVTLTAVALLREHLTEANHREVLDWAEGRRKREVEEFVRALDPRPDVPTSLRRLAPPRAAVARAVAAERGAAAQPDRAWLLGREAGEPGVAREVVGLAAPQPVALAAREATEPGVALEVVGLAAPQSVAFASPEATEPGVALEVVGLAAPQPVAFAAREALGAGVPLGTVDRAALEAVAPSTHRPSPAPHTGAGDRRVEIRPLAPARYSLRVTISQETHDKLRRAQDLLRHAGTADAAVVLDRALTLLVAHLERQKAGAARRRDKREPTSAGRSATQVAVDPKAGAARQRGTREAASSGRSATQAAGDSKAGAAKNARLIAATGNRPASGADVDLPPARTNDLTVVQPAEASGPAAVPAAVDSTPAPARGDGRVAEPSGAKAAALRSRYIPAVVRRAVWERDGARCAYVSPGGVRCGATARLEFHHRVPFAEGGASTVENVAVACRLHNQAEAARWFNFDQAEFAATWHGGA